jgi:hypothetical protein
MMPSGIWVLSGVVSHRVGKSSADLVRVVLVLAKEKQCKESLALQAGKDPLVRLWAHLKGLVKALRTVYGSIVE